MKYSIITINFTQSFLLLSALMLKVKNILQSKTLIVALGLMVGLAVLGQPLLKQYCNDSICQKEQKADETEDETSNSDEVVSMLEALVPISQVLDASTQYFVLTESVEDQGEDTTSEIVFFSKVFDKLTRVLFNFIIAPNAP